jgi:hypothetical protein
MSEDLELVLIVKSVCLFSLVLFGSLGFLYQIKFS